MMVAAARCLLLSPVCCSPSSATLRLPRIIRPPRSSCSASPLAVVASMHAPPQGYRTNVGICLANPSLTKIFSASRIDIPSAWQMPQGGIDEGEDPRVAAVRELKEETGVTSAEIVAEVKLTGTPCKLGVCLVCSRLETLLHVFSANIFWHARWDTKEANMTSTEKSATTADIDFDAIIVPTLADLTSEQRKEIEDRKAALEEVMLGCYQKTRWGVTQKTALPMLNPIGDDSIPTKPVSRYMPAQAELSAMIEQSMHHALTNQSSALVTTLKPMIENSVKTIAQELTSSGGLLDPLRPLPSCPVFSIAQNTSTTKGSALAPAMMPTRPTVLAPSARLDEITHYQAYTDAAKLGTTTNLPSVVPANAFVQSVPQPIESVRVPQPQGPIPHRVVPYTEPFVPISDSPAVKRDEHNQSLQYQSVPSSRPPEFTLGGQDASYHNWQNSNAQSARASRPPEFALGGQDASYLNWQNSNAALADNVNRADQISAVLRDQFGLQPKGKVIGYRKPYPDYIDRIPYPNDFRVPNFAKFSGDDYTTTLEHVGRFIAQCGEAAHSAGVRVKLFPLSLTGAAFTWFTTLPPNSVNTWADLESRFHKYFFRGSLELRISDLSSIRQKFGESVTEYIKRFREIRNQCFSVTLPDNQLADLAFQGLIPPLKENFCGQEFTNLSHLLRRVSVQEIRFSDNEVLKDECRNNKNIIQSTIEDGRLQFAKEPTMEFAPSPFSINMVHYYAKRKEPIQDTELSRSRSKSKKPIHERLSTANQGESSEAPNSLGSDGAPKSSESSDENNNLAGKIRKPIEPKPRWCPSGLSRSQRRRLQRLRT